MNLQTCVYLDAQEAFPAASEHACVLGVINLPVIM